MSKVLFFFLIMFSYTLAFAQPFRYSDKIFDKSDTLRNVEYATAEWLNNPFSLLPDVAIHDGENKTELRPLLMDIFLPKNDTLDKRPAIIFAHSGGFLMGSNQNDDMLAFCDSFAQRGYVTASLAYRIGMGADITRIFGFPVKLSLSAKNAERAVYRATQDSKAAIRFLKHNAKNFGIDTSKIYVVGSSAGGFIALHNLYMNKVDEIPESTLEAPSLGNLNAVGLQGYGGRANGIVSMWGALEKPELIEDENTPVFLIHGTADDIVYFEKGMPLKSLVPENDALEFSIPETYGSYCVDTALDNRQIKHSSYFVQGKKHEFYGVATGMFGEEGPNAYWDTIQWKINDFLLDIFRPVPDFESQNNGLTVQFYNESSDTSSSEWDFGDGVESHLKNPVHTYQQSGNYKIRLKVCNKNMACDTLTKSISLTQVGLTEEVKNEIRIFPVPARDYLVIEGIQSQYSGKILDTTGRARITFSGTENKQIDLRELQNGIFIVMLESGNKKVFKKFLKQK